jgi:S1-C subfamily serine protease
VLDGRHPLAGSKVANLSPAVSAELGLDDDSKTGVVVLEVPRRSHAGRLGLRRGDIIAGMNDQEIASVKELVVLLQARGGGWRLAVERGGKIFNLAIQG